MSAALVDAVEGWLRQSKLEQLERVEVRTALRERCQEFLDKRYEGEDPESTLEDWAIDGDVRCGDEFVSEVIDGGLAEIPSSDWGYLAVEADGYTETYLTLYRFGMGDQVVPAMVMTIQ